MEESTAASGSITTCMAKVSTPGLTAEDMTVTTKMTKSMGLESTRGPTEGSITATGSAASSMAEECTYYLMDR
jgi:hypothetical protein